MMERTLEPELMIDSDQVLAYSNADFADSNHSFVEMIKSRLPEFAGSIIDVGCGPGDVTLLLAKALPGANVVGIDGSTAMIAEARRKWLAADVGDRVRFEQAYIPSETLLSNSFDVVVSKDLLHHLPDPQVLWREVSRLCRNRISAFVMDLRRPASQQAAHNLVQQYAADAPEVLQEDFYNSLLAAFTPEEIRAQFEQAGLHHELSVHGDRHLFIEVSAR